MVRREPHRTDNTNDTLSRALTLLPTPAVNDMGESKTPDQWRVWVADMEAQHHNSNGHGNSLSIEARGVSGGWGPYTAAIERWEHHLCRPAPHPTKPGPHGPRLSPLFVEWLMGLPHGWVTEVPGLTRRSQLQMLGNGAVPQQVEAALRHLGINGIFTAVKT